MIDFSNERLKPILFDVREEPIFTSINGEFTQVPGRKAIVRDDTNSVLGVMAKRYSAMNNKHVLEEVDKLLQSANINYEIGNCWSKMNGASSKMEIILPDFKIDARHGNDSNQLRMYIDNSFNGQSSILTQMGFFRQICTNGMVVGKVEKSYGIKHLGDVTQKAIISFQDFLDKKFKETETYINDLTETSFLSTNEVERMILEDKEIIGERYRKMVVDIWNQKYERSTNAWYILNAFTEVVTHSVRANMFAKMDMFNKLRKLSLKWMNKVIEPDLMED